MIAAIELRSMLQTAIAKGQRIKRTKASKLATVKDKRMLSDTWFNREPRPGAFHRAANAKPKAVLNVTP